MQHSILIGNGINIQFSDSKDEYINRSIILRALYNIKAGKYTKAFGNIVEPNFIFDGVIDLVNWCNNYLFKGLNYKNAVISDDEFFSFFDSVFNYKNKQLNPEDILMEDYFLFFDLFNNYFNNKNKTCEQVKIEDVYAALLIIFTDAIYNDGKIELLHKNMSSFAPELNKYDNIFTINYDSNLDKISSKPIYHLHGKFDALQDRFIPTTILGFINYSSKNPISYIQELKHSYSNAVMGFSGKEKVKYINYYNKSSLSLHKIIQGLNDPNDIQFHSEYERLKLSNEKRDKYALQAIKAKMMHPELTYTEYPLDIFSKISGWLSIIGMSPNNDSHIIQMINENNNLLKVIYYYKFEKERDWMLKNINKERHLICKKVDTYWTSIRCQ